MRANLSPILALALGLAASALEACFDPLLPIDASGITSSSGSASSSDTVSTSVQEATTTYDATTSSSLETDGSSGSREPAEPICGDGVLDPGEQCDHEGESSTCDEDCTFAECGDGVLNSALGESCDDGKLSQNCDDDCTVVECGDGTLNPFAGEECEERGETEACDADCTFVVCGDGTLNQLAGEQCDDAGESATCNADCTSAWCGDGVINTEAGEACDDSAESPDCDDDCSLVVCGDGSINDLAGEACDDGNVLPDDGCGPSCLIEVPDACYGNIDPISGDLWVVCSADANEAWIAQAVPAGGNFHPEIICASLGYASVGGHGGTCGSICGYCQSGTSCLDPGSPVFDGGGQCGEDRGGPVLCTNVHWLCTNP